MQLQSYFENIYMRIKSVLLPYITRREFVWEIMLALLSGLLGTIGTSTGIAPLAAAIVAAAWMSGRNPYYALFGAVTGALLFGRYASALATVIYIPLCLLWRLWRGKLKKLDKLLIVLIAQGMVFPFFYLKTLENCILGLANTALCAIFTAVLQNALMVVMTIRQGHLLSDDDQISICALGALLVLSLSSLNIAGVSPGIVLAVLLTLLAAYVKGTAGVAASVAVSAALVLGGGSDILFIGNAAACALAAAAARKLGRYGVAAGFGLCTALIWHYAGNSALAVGLPEYFIAAGVFLMLPRKLLSQTTVLSVTTGSKHGASDFFKLKETVQERLTDTVEVLRQVAELFTASADPKAEAYQRQLAVQTATECVCSYCEHRQSCWSNPKEAVDALIAMLVYGDSGTEDAMQPINPNCAYIKSVLMATSNALHQQSLLYTSQRQADDYLLFTNKQLKGVCTMLNSLSAKLDLPSHNRSIKKRYDIKVGAAACAKSGSTHTGDSMAIRDLSNCKRLMMLSDGMGSGKTAHKESSAAVALLGDLLEVGFDRDAALECVNRLLIAKGSDDMYTTLDALLINLTNGTGEFIKFAASPSFVIRNGSVHTLYAEALPMGILTQAKPAMHSVQFKTSDTVIMLTDGVYEALGNDIGAVLLEQVSSANTADDAANAVLDAAYRQSHLDDMSVIVIRLGPP